MNTTPTPAFTVDEVLKASWAMTKKHWKQYLLLVGAAILVYIAYGIVYGILSGVLHLPGIIDNILSFFVGVYVSLLMARGALAIARDQKLDLNAIARLDGKTLLQACLATVLFYLAVMVGLLLLIIPGIIAAIMFCFYTCLWNNYNWC